MCLPQGSGTSHCFPLTTLVLSPPHAVFQWLPENSRCEQIGEAAHAQCCSMHVCCMA